MQATDKPVLDLPPGRRLAVMLTVMVTAIVMNAAAFTATTILPQMQGALSATQDEISWTMTFNLLATAIMLPLAGWIIPRFGRRLVLYVSMFCFTVTTFMCGLANSLESIIFWRILQGAAGAPLMPLCQILLLDMYPRDRQAFVISIFGIANTIGPVLGPLAGAYLAEHASWRWGFYMLVPFGAMATFAAYSLLPHDEPTGKRPDLDWLGFGALSLAIACLQYILSRGQRVDWYQAQEIMIATLAGAFAFYIFVVHVWTTPSPFVDLRMLRDRNYAVGLILVIAFGMLSFAPMVLLPPLMQIQMGFPEADVGTMISWRGFGVTVGFFISMALSRADERVLIAIAFAMHVWSGLWLMTLDLNARLFDFSANVFLQGISVGVVWAPISTVTFRTIAPERRPEAMAMFHLVRSVATSAFIAVSVAMIVRVTGANYSRLSEAISPYNKVLSMPATIGGYSTETTGGLAALAREINRQATMLGYINSFVMYTVVSAVVLPLVLLIGRKPQRA